MAATWSSIKLTTKGKALQAKMIAGNTFEFTKAVTSAAVVTAAEQETIVSLPDIKQTITIQPSTINSDGTVQFRLLLSNFGVTTAYTAHTIGIYANDPDEGEVLYFTLTDAEGEGIPSYQEAPNVSRLYKIKVGIGNADTVEIHVDAQNFATHEWLDYKIEAHNTDPTAHANTFASKADMDAHISDTDIHTTAAEKVAWSAHIADTSNPHGVTLAQIGAEAAGSAAGVQSNLDAHAGDTDNHVTTAEKAKWNAGGKKYATLVVGSASSGHTADDVDYLCDGTDDQVEIQAALDALSSAGGKVLLLEGTYSLTAGIHMTKDHVTLEGMGGGTQLELADQSAGIHMNGRYCTLNSTYIEPANGFMPSHGVIVYGWRNMVFGNSMIGEFDGAMISIQSTSCQTSVIGNCIDQHQNDTGGGYIQDSGYMTVKIGNAGAA